jgi:EAL domain-containing protein (putative c-di-GMP-specific phosphodiesterase class I)
MKVVAEGIETADQTAALKEFGCDYGQGYHFSRPLPVQQATDWLSRHQHRLPEGSGAA